MTVRRITQIPLPGGSGQVPTGPLMIRIRYLVGRIGDHEDPGVQGVTYHLSELADLIERDVVVRPETPT